MEQMYVPLAERMRPQNLKDVIGQEHVTSRSGMLGMLAHSKQPASLILWGPPGTGKTTIARILQQEWTNNGQQVDFVELSAVTAGVSDIRKVIERAESNRRLGQHTVLFVDEVHRFNKAQQDAFLPHIESGLITLIGATTENPSFEVNNALLSRARVVVLRHLDEKSLAKIITKAAKVAGSYTLQPQAKATLIRLSGGDARTAITTIELAAQLATKDNRVISQAHIETVLQRESVQFDKAGDGHYDLISACIKSMRGNSDEAALYYLHRLLIAGETPTFIARRLIIFASEDIGLAAPYALTLATACFDAVAKIGMPEAEYVLSHVVVALARSPKSRETTDMMYHAKSQVASAPNAAVPLHLRNAPTKLMKSLGYNDGYEWKAGFTPEQGFMPDLT